MNSLKIRFRFNFKHAASESKCRSSLHSIVDHGFGKNYVILAYFMQFEDTCYYTKYDTCYLYTGYHESYRLKEEDPRLQVTNYSRHVCNDHEVLKNSWRS